MIRAILAVLFVVIFLILSIPIWLVLNIIKIFNKEANDKIGFWFVTHAFKGVMFFSGTKLTINGLDKVPTDRPVLYVANHNSIFDVVIGYALCPTVTGFMAKDSIKKIPLLSTWMSRLYCIFLTRTNPREDLKLMLQAVENVKNGISAFVFPEGTRSKTGEMGEFHDAIFKIATKSGCPIVPVAFTPNTADIFEKHIPFIRSQKITVTYLEPIYLENLTPEEKKTIGSYTKAIIQAQLDAYKAQ